MGRESEDAKDERQRRAGRWLRGQRDSRRLSQRDVADRLGIAQQTYSRYEKGHLAIPHECVAGLAEMMRLPEVDVWRGLELPLPAAFRTDADVIQWARDNMRELMDQLPDAAERITGGKPPEALRQETRRSGHVTRKSGHGDSASRGARSAV